MIDDLEWCIDVIASNRLYETNMIKGNEKNEEVKN